MWLATSETRPLQGTTDMTWGGGGMRTRTIRARGSWLEKTTVSGNATVQVWAAWDKPAATRCLAPAFHKCREAQWRTSTHPWQTTSSYWLFWQRTPALWRSSCTSSPQRRRPYTTQRQRLVRTRTVWHDHHTKINTHSHDQLLTRPQCYYTSYISRTCFKAG